MLLTSFGYTWSSMLHETTGYQRMVGHSLQNSTQPPAYLPARRLFGDNGIETSTLWNYKVIGRYVMPFDIGVSGSWQVQSGQQYGRTISVNFPGDGTRTIRVEPITANRYPNVSILDFRSRQDVPVRDAPASSPGMVDVFNLLNERHGHRLPHRRRSNYPGGHRDCSTRGSCGSAFGTTSRPSGGISSAVRERGQAPGPWASGPSSLARVVPAQYGLPGTSACTPDR